MYSAVLEINVGNSKILKVLDLPKYKRSNVITKKQNGKIIFKIKSKDAVALAATLSSIVKQLTVVSNVRSIIKQE